MVQLVTIKTRVLDTPGLTGYRTQHEAEHRVQYGMASGSDVSAETVIRSAVIQLRTVSFAGMLTSLCVEKRSCFHRLS